MKVVICLQSNFSKILENFAYRAKYSLESLYPFLNTVVIFAFFKMDGNVDFYMDSLKNPQIKSAKMSAFSVTTRVGISVFSADCVNLDFLSRFSPLQH